MPPMFVDNYIPVPGAEYGGGIAEMVHDRNFVDLRRPYFDKRGRPAVTINRGRWTVEKGQRVPLREHTLVKDLWDQGINVPVLNVTSLRKDEWKRMDETVLMCARERMRAWADLAAANTYGGFDGMASTILEHELMSDAGEAIVDMDGLTEGRTDSPLFELVGLPLPITHSDFWFSLRRLKISRKGDKPLDLTMGEQAGRKVGEMIEKTTIGVETGIGYGVAADYTDGLPTVYGYTNFPQRLTKTDMSAPTGANGTTILTNWLALRQLLYDAHFYGPYMVYTSADYDQYLDNLFSTTEPSAGTLRARLKQIDDIQDIRRLDYLTNTFTVLMVQMTSDVARAVDGMGITTIQWESVGGMRLNFKVMAIQAPQLRHDYNDNCGIAHGTTA